MKDGVMFRALLVLLFAIGQFIAPQAPRLVKLANLEGLVGIGTPIGDVGGTSPAGPEQPSGYAFAIWGLIFTLALLFAVRQLLPSRRDAALYQTIGGAAVVLFAAASAWMLVAQYYGNGWVLVAIIWLMLFAAARGLYRTLYTGWLAAAAWLNTGAVLKRYTLVPVAFTPSLYAAVVLLLIAALSLFLLRRANGYLPLAATTIWALGGIAHANIVLRPNTQVATLAIGLALLVIGYLVWQRRPVAKPEF
jgi:hypothetical protein